MAMPERKFSASAVYRYGFNGKENDKDAGEGIQDYGMRIYDSRLGRFLSVDPLVVSFPYYTPYQYAGNMPIAAIDLDGLEQHVVIYYKDQNNATTKILVRAIFNNDGTVLDQDIHKVGETEHIAKGNVLVFEIKNEGSKKQSMEIVQKRNTAESKLTSEEQKIFDKYKKLQNEPYSPDESLVYPTEKNYTYESGEFKSADTKTYQAKYGIVPPLNITINGNKVKLNTEYNTGVYYESAYPVRVGGSKGWNDAQRKIDAISTGLKGTSTNILIKGYVSLPEGFTLDSMIPNEKYTFRQLAQKRIDDVKSTLISGGIKESQIKSAIPKTGHTEQKATVIFTN